MIPKQETIENLLELVSQLVINEKTVLLYLYYCIHGEKSPTREEVQRGTGLALNTIRKHDQVLVAIGAISHGEKRGRGKGSETRVFDFEKPTTPQASSYISILNIPSQKSNASLILHERYSKEEEKGSGRFLKRDIDGDPDWLEAKKHLETHFKEFELDTTVLTKKNRFAMLVELVNDAEFDFPAYCRWYADNKYRDKGFNWGLFLYPTMIAEYRDYIEREGKYLKTTSRMKTSGSFKNEVDRTKDFLSRLGDDDEN